MTFEKYLTKQGETWFSIAWDTYGALDDRLGELMRLNSGVPFYYLFPMGIELGIPIYDPAPIPQVPVKSPWI